MNQLIKLISFITISLSLSSLANAHPQHMRASFYNAPQNFGLPIMRVIPKPETKEVDIIVSSALLNHGSVQVEQSSFEELAKEFEMDHFLGLVFTFPEEDCRSLTLSDKALSQLFTCTHMGFHTNIKVRGAGLDWTGEIIESNDKVLTAQRVIIKVTNINEQSATGMDQFLRVSTSAVINLKETAKSIYINGIKDHVADSPLNGGFPGTF